MPLLKLALEFGPLVIFFITNNRLDIYAATPVFMGATILSLLASKLILKKIPIMLWVTCCFVLVFGGLTWALHDERFIKIKPTIVNLVFAITLVGGLYFGRLLVKILLGDVIKLRDEGWRKLTIRWAAFFLFLAILNEVIWRGFSTEIWIAYKTFGVIPLTFLFMMAQIGLLQKYQLPEDMADAPSQ